jgi:hypothetical protein
VGGGGVRVRLVEGIGHAHAFDGLLSEPVHHLRCRDAGNVEDRGHDVDEVVELGTNAASVFDPVWPSDDHTLPGAAEVGGDLFGPLERRIKGPRPSHCHVGSGLRGAPDVVILQLIRNRNVDAFARSQVEGRADGRAFCARAVVAADVDHERIVELAHVIHGLDDPTDLC